ncbi:MAG: cytochrome c [Rhodospirillales bacterium]|nr:cytochrome c [Rhodospirillales bacterium]
MKINRAVSTGVIAVVLIAASFGLYKSLAPKGGADPDDGRQVALGEQLYRAHCASCHGVNLEGQADWRTRNADGTLKPPPHDETGHTWHHPDRLLFDYTKQGGGPTAPPGFTSAMPGFAGTLSDAETWAVLAFIKSRWPQAIRDRQRQIDGRSR